MCIFHLFTKVYVQKYPLFKPCSASRRRLTCLQQRTLFYSQICFIIKVKVSKHEDACSQKEYLVEICFCLNCTNFVYPSAFLLTIVVKS